MSFLTDTVKNLGNTVGGSVGNYLGKDNPVNPIPKGRTSPLPEGDYTYADIFRQAYKNLNQPNAPEEIIVGGTKSLADAFIDRVHQKTGQFPTEQQVKDFVASNLTTSYAEKFITGLPADQVKVNMVDPYLVAHSDDFSKAADPNAATIQSEIESRQKGLAERLQQIYGQQREALKGSVEESYGEQKGNIVKDLAGQGMLYNQPGSRGILDRLEAAKGRSLTQGMASLAGTQATGETDIAKTIEGLLANERRAGEESKRFGMEYGLANNKLQQIVDQASQDRALQKYGFDVAGDVGRRQAAAGKQRDWFDYTDLGIRGLSTILSGIAAIKGK